MAASTSSSVAYVTNKTSRVLCVWISQYYTVHERSPVLTVAPQTLLSCFKDQTSDEELPQLSGLFGRLLNHFIEKSPRRKQVVLQEGGQEVKFSASALEGNNYRNFFFHVF